MLGVGGGEWIAIGVLALVLFGPERMQVMAKQAGRFTHDIRLMMAKARRDLDSELGMDTSAFNVRDLDPRTYVRKHVLPDLDDGPTTKPRSAGGPTDRSRNAESSGGVDQPSAKPKFDPDAT